MNRGIGFTGMLGLLFIALKLTNVIDWSWGLVLLPLYLPLLFIVGIVLIYVLTMVTISITMLIKNRWGK